jgi:hypothetical protein
VVRRADRAGLADGVPAAGVRFRCARRSHDVERHPRRSENAESHDRARSGGCRQRLDPDVRRRRRNEKDDANESQCSRPPNHYAFIRRSSWMRSSRRPRAPRRADDAVRYAAVRGVSRLVIRSPQPVGAGNSGREASVVAVCASRLVCVRQRGLCFLPAAAESFVDEFEL